MQRLIDSTVKFRQQHEKGNPASIETIRYHLDDVYKVVQYENNQNNKSYSGIRAQVISTTVSFLLELKVYTDYLLDNDILDSDFFILIRDIIARAFKETRHEFLVTDEERKLLTPVCDIILKITESMTTKQANSKMIPLFFDKAFVLSMVDVLKVFASNNIFYDADQKAMIIKIILNMFSEYCLVQDDAALSTAHLINLVNAALCCISSRTYLRLFHHELQPANFHEKSSATTELFLNVCPTYVVQYKKARHEAMFVEAKLCIVHAASQILPRFLSQKDELPSYLLRVRIITICK